jgi:hypothetical protein
MTGNSYIPQNLLKAMHTLTLPWLLEQNFTHVVTLAFNRPTTLNGGRVSLNRFHAKLDRLLLGPRWYKKPQHERSFFHAYPENISSNLHYNMPLRVNAEHIEMTTSKIDDIWSSKVKVINTITTQQVRGVSICHRVSQSVSQL